MLKRLSVLLCVMCFVVPLCGCQRETGFGKTIRFDLPYAIKSLDPQFATDPYSRMIINNIGEGLLTRDETGNLDYGVAESYTVSSDKKTFVFKLREEACWQDGNPVTAEDFVFALRRLFSADLPSPHAKNYSAIEAASAILAGKAPLESLGVSALDDKTLEIKLEHPSPYFPWMLADTPSFPCNRDFFTQSRGRYGLDFPFVLSNGPFRLEKWDSQSVIQLRPSAKFKSSPITQSGVNLYVAPENPLSRFLNGTTDVGEISFEDAEKLNSQNYNVDYFESTVWCIVFNQNSGVWGNPLLRQGVSHTIEQGLWEEQLPQRLSATSFFLPQSAMLADKPYRRNVHTESVAFDPATGHRLFDMGLSSLGLANLPDTTLFVPDSAGHFLSMGMVQQSWQKHLYAYINVTAEPLKQIEARLYTGDFDMLLLPFSSDSPQASYWFENFESTSPKNRFGYNNPLYDGFIESARRAETFEEAASNYANAESLLLHDALIIPVYAETSAIASIQSVRGLPCAQYPSELSFKFAEK